MRQFVHETPPRRVVFGAGALSNIAEEVHALGLERVLVISGGSAQDAGAEVAHRLGRRCAASFDEVRQHVPESLAIQAIEAAKAHGVDGLCSVGGGSATGLAKAVAVELALPIVAVPTTYAGSEMTAIYGVTGTHKRTGTDPRAQPQVVIYDPELTVGLPARVTVTSGLNAIAHAVAALLLENSDPVAHLHAQEAVQVLAAALTRAVRAPADLPARTEAFYGAFLAGSALAAGTGLHHRLAHILGGSHRLVHADVHAVLLPHTVAYEHDRATPGIQRVVAALDAADPAAHLHTLATELGAPTSLAALGLAAAGLPSTVQRAADDFAITEPAARARLAQLLHDAHAGRPPRSPEDPDLDRGGTP